MPILFFLTCLLLLIKTPTEAHNILCNEGDWSTLLALRSELVFDSLRSTRNSHKDCCRWDGIECDSIGLVISLRLDFEGISSGINGSSSLFRLSHLKKLSLADNTLDKGIKIPKEIPTELDHRRSNEFRHSHNNLSVDASHMNSSFFRSSSLKFSL
ncbi:hypothetical protein C2S52_020969 [Perilla frutescens var. hirtella]|nr:hypothetical protein C2S52_020969 [Perilla frutescens var. hirtella]